MQKPPDTHTHTLHSPQLNEQISHFKHWHARKRVEGTSRLTLTICGIIYLKNILFWYLTIFRISHHTTPFSSHQVICSWLASTSLLLLHTDTPIPYKDTLRGAARALCSPSPSQAEWEKFTLAFFFFFHMFSEAVVMVIGYKDSSGSQCTWEGRAQRLCLSVNECVFVSCIIPRIIPWRGSRMICLWSAGTECR